MHSCTMYVFVYITFPLYSSVMHAYSYTVFLVYALTEQMNVSV